MKSSAFFTTALCVSLLGAVPLRFRQQPCKRSRLNVYKPALNLWLRCPVGFLLLATVSLFGIFAPIASAQAYIYGRADFPVGNNPRAIAAGDFNGDGKLDFAVVNFNDGTVSILLGKPDGTLASKVDYPTSQQPTFVAVGDFNEDGNLDLAVTNENCHSVSIGGVSCDPGTVSILLGNGDGTFQSAVPYGTGSGSLAVAVGDFNGDGKLDVVTANSSDSTVSILLGKGDGTFANHVDYATDQVPVWVVLADFNGDHKPDLAVATNYGASVLLGNGDGTFQTHSDYNLQVVGVSLVAADFNGDGKIDLALASSYGSFVHIFLGNGDGTFISAASYGLGLGPSSIVSEDFNHDGKADLAIAFGCADCGGGTGIVSIFLGNGDGTFQPGIDYGTGFNPLGMTVGDVNGDGAADLAAVAACGDLSDCSGPGAVSVLLGLKDGTFVGKKPFATGNGPGVVLSADFNHDGKLDLAIPIVGNSVSLLLGNGDGTFQPALNFSTGPLPYAAAIGDFNGDGNMDLATANETCPTIPCGSGSVSILLGNGDGTFKPHVEYATGVGPQSVTTADFNGDSKLDLAIANNGFNSGNTVSILLGKGDGTFLPHVDYLTTNVPLTVATGDFNMDGKLDLVVGNFGTISIFLGKGDGTFQPRVDYPAIGNQSIVVADFNGDGKADLATEGSILLGNGDGTFQPHMDYRSGVANMLGLGDFNSDGIPDLAVPSSQTKVSILLGKGDGTFIAPVSYEVVNQILSSFTVADFNGDGVPDLAATDANLDTVSIILSTAFKAVYPTALNFGSQGVGTTSGLQTITLTNPSHVSFGISGISISGDFTETNNCGVKLAPKQNCTIKVRFSPSTTGTRTGSITLTDGTSSSPQVIPLTGAGLNGPFLTVSPGRLNFDPEAIGNSSTPASIQVSNTGNSVLQISTVGVTGTSSTDFSESTTCGSSLTAGSTCAISVTFKPTMVGTRTGTVSITDNAAGSPHVINLAGVGIDPFSLSSTSAITQTVTAGQPATYQLSAASNGGFAGNVSLSCGNVPPKSTCSVNPANVTLTSNGNATFAVSVTTMANSFITYDRRIWPSLRSGPRTGLLYGLALLALVLAVLSRTTQPRLALAGGAVLMLLFAGCGGGNGSTVSPTNNGTPTGTYTISVSGSAQGTTQAMNLTLVVQ